MSEQPKNLSACRACGTHVPQLTAICPSCGSYEPGKQRRTVPFAAQVGGRGGLLAAALFGLWASPIACDSAGAFQGEPMPEYGVPPMYADPVPAYGVEPTPPPDNLNPPLSFAADTPRPVQARSEIPGAVAPGVPQRGIYAAGGGLTNSAWRVIVDLDTLSVQYSESEAHGSSSVGEMDQNWNWIVAHPDLAPIVEAADRAWRAERVVTEDPIVDYMELLILADGEQVFVLDGHGPIIEPAAQGLIDALRSLARPTEKR